MSAGRERTEDVRNAVARIKRLLGLDVNRLAVGDAFEGTQYAPLGVNVIEFVNLSTSIAPQQAGSGGPAQVTGLSAVVNSDTQITLSWTAVSGATSYNVYYGFMSGGASNLAGNVTSAGAIHNGLTPGTTYWYQVAAVNAVGEGPLSAEVSATTTAPAPNTASLWLQFNNSLVDSSPNSNTVTFVPTGGNVIYGSPGKFGSHYAITNYPTTTTIDSIKVPASTSTALDLTSVGFSFSFWFYIPTGSGTGAADLAWLVAKYGGTTGNHVLLDYRSSVVGGDDTLVLDVNKAGTHYVRKSLAAVSFDTWHHVVCTFNAATNTAQIYYDKVAGTSGSASGFTTGETITDWRIGLSPGTSNVNKTFRGRFDEFQYFKGRVLNQTEVNNLFNNNDPGSGGPPPPTDTTPPAQVTGLVVS